MINLPPDATGVVAMETRDVTVQLLNANGEVIFESSDPRLQALELRIAPNTGQHQLIIERSTSAATGMVRLHSQFDIRTYADSMRELALVSTGNTIEKGQELDSDLNIDQAANTVSIQANGNTPISVSSSFLGANVTWQMVDNLNQVVATLFGGSIDGISMILDAGQYEVSMLNNNPQVRTVANLRVEDVPDETMLMLLPATTDTFNVNNTDATGSTNAVAAANCTTTIGVSSINLRSGPGTGYSVLEYAFRNDSYPVGGITPNGEWVLVGLDNASSAWMMRSLGSESGACNDLTVFDIPLLDAPDPQVTFVTTSKYAIKHRLFRHHQLL